VWSANTDIAAGTRIRYYGKGSASGYEHEYSGGRTGSKQPTFSTTLAGVSAADGSGTWTARAITTASLYRTITGTPTWTPDDGLTAGTPAIVGTIANCALSGGTDGEDYLVEVKATFSDTATHTAVCQLPVRKPIEAECEA
jgi:hypothetical protein